MAFRVEDHLKDEEAIAAFRRAIDTFGDPRLSEAAGRTIFRARTINARRAPAAGRREQAA